MQFLDPVEPLDADWSAWEGLDRQPLYVAEISGPNVNGHPVPSRFAGVYAEPARVVCGLRVWDDAREGKADEAPWVLFEVEKLVRMALHQSGLAFELLASSRCFSVGFPARDIVRASVTRNVVAYYRDVARSLVTDPGAAAELWRWRTLLTGLLLARTGEVSLHLETLLAATEELAEDVVDTPPPRSSLVRLVEELDDFGDALPAAPTDYEWLDEFVAAQRLGAV